MTRIPCAVAASCFAIAIWFSASILIAQEPTPTPTAGSRSELTQEKAVALAEQGHCKEALPPLKRILAGQGPVEGRKKAGITGLHCALSIENPDAALDFLRLLNHQFPQDPEVLFVLVHAYSDLSSLGAQ